MDDMRNELLAHYQCGLLTKLGIKTSEVTIKKASVKNIEKLYNEYQIKYNSLVADDLVSNLLLGYTHMVKYMFPNLEHKKLHEKLTDNVIINNEVKKQLGQYMNPTMLAIGTVAANTAEASILSLEESTEQVLIVEDTEIKDI